MGVSDNALLLRADCISAPSFGFARARRLDMLALSMPRPVILLGVNIDHAATLRQARYRDADAQPAAMVEPDPVAIALLAEKAGADGITAHLREDRRHIQDRDIRRLRDAVTTRLNMENPMTVSKTKNTKLLVS
jgi:hypothetical protein